MASKYFIPQHATDLTYYWSTKSGCENDKRCHMNKMKNVCPEHLEWVMKYLDMKSLFNLNISSILKQFADGMDTLDDKKFTDNLKKEGLLKDARIGKKVLYLKLHSCVYKLLNLKYDKTNCYCCSLIHPFFAAVCSGSIPDAKMFLKYGIDINMTYACGCGFKNALNNLVELSSTYKDDVFDQKHIDMFEFLLQNGCDLSYVDKFNNPTLHCLAFSNGNPSILKILKVMEKYITKEMLIQIQEILTCDMSELDFEEKYGITRNDSKKKIMQWFHNQSRRLLSDSY